MNIHAKKGDKVLYTATGGYDSDKEHADTFLKKDKIYTVDYTEVNSWYTNVYLKEIPNEYFNSVHFEDI